MPSDEARAFTTRYVMGKRAAVTTNTALLAELNAVTTNDDLARATAFAAQALTLELGLLGPAPAGPPGASKAGWALGALAAALFTAWSRAQLIAFLRAACPTDPRLAAEASARAADTVTATAELRAGLAGDARFASNLDRLTLWLEEAPVPDAITSQMSDAGAFGEIKDWLVTLDLILAGLAASM